LFFSVHLMGDIIWASCGGEPYNYLAVEIRRRFPNHMLVISPLAGDMQVAYLMPVDRYGLGLYEEEPSILAQGCLDLLVDAIAARVTEQLYGEVPGLGRSAGGQGPRAMADEQSKVSDH
ncbi:MAG: Neutral/alkaline non-lysosomal ceramidase, partial [Chloroflexi bacterium]|nr:Neutral/alkaline non-lysosomal ceramidase [Chloroflexota bacterium]